MKRDTHGLLFIGDPHLEARVPGFRCDDYPQVALGKLAWCLDFAHRHSLQPILLGDLFHLPQDNPNWLISQIIEILTDHGGHALPAIHGNHDIRENARKPNDSISILVSGGHLRMLSADDPWIGQIAGRRVIVGGTSWNEKFPRSFETPKDSTDDAIVVWVTHHDILIPGYEESGRIRPTEISGIDLIVNGHVHRRLPTVTKGATHWITAGNITRRARSDASRSHVPAVACLVPAEDTEIVADPGVETFGFRSSGGDDWDLRWVRVPHQPFDEVFHGDLQSDDLEEDETLGSGFVADLRELTERKTDTGAGLMQFLEQNIHQFDDAVGIEIMRLAREVTESD